MGEREKEGDFELQAPLNVDPFPPLLPLPPPMDPYILLDQAELLQNSQRLQAAATSSQSKSILLLETLIKRKDFDLRAQLAANDVLSSEVASLKATVAEMDRYYHALEDASTARINKLSRELHPTGHWRWTWEGGREEKKEVVEGVEGVGTALSSTEKQELYEKIQLAGDSIHSQAISIIQESTVVGLQVRRLLSSLSIFSDGRSSELLLVLLV